jgi:hypothetical protein
MASDRTASALRQPRHRPGPSAGILEVQGENQPAGSTRAGGVWTIMGKDKLLVLAVFGLIAGAALLLRSGGGPGSPGAEPPPPLRPSAPREFLGISMQLYYSEADHPYEACIDEIVQTGANTICFVVAGYQENAGSTSIFIESRKIPSVDRFLKLMEYSHKRGLKVAIMPIVLLENPREGEWRGKINPEGANAKWEDWWEDYTNYILHYANLAERAKAEILMIGSELISTETQEDRWRGLIKKVRAVFKHEKGRLSYSSNWDHYRPIKWWNDLDIIGMTTYYDLSGGKKPTMDVLLEAWKPIKKEILEWQVKINRPIVFTEVGWPNQETCAQYPWDYYRSPDKPDPQAQKNCFEAFFQTWDGEPAVAGYFVWEWRCDPTQKVDPLKDTSYVPFGKPSMEVIKKYYNRTRPATTAKGVTRPETNPQGQ